MMTIKHLRAILSTVAIIFSIMTNAQSDIYEAARKGDLKTLKELYKSDKDIINKKNSQGYTPLILATYYNQVEFVKFLTKSKVALQTEASSSTALQAACYKGYTAIADELLNYGSNPNLYDANGTTPLIYASQFGHVEIVKLLLKKGADKNYTDPNGRTALDFAQNLDQEEIKILLKN